jgi:hypothetical protein
MAVAFQRAIVRADAEKSTRAATAALQAEVKKLLKKVCATLLHVGGFFDMKCRSR